MEKLLNIFILLLVYNTLISCEKLVPTYKGTLIKYETELSLNVKKSFNRGDLYLNDRYTINGQVPLISYDSIPNWIKNPRKNAVSFKKRDTTLAFNPTLYDIPVPYFLSKKKDDSTFLVIKNEDTLQFSINIPEGKEFTIKEFFENLKN